ncbi:hypothetical protein [[Eubacterium] cellulosolvens]
MKISNPIVRGFYSGLIAGCIGGLILTIQRILDAILGTPVVPVDLLDFDILMFHLGYSIPSNGMWGSIYGIVYSRFYDRVPGKAVKKGFVWGCIIFFISNIWITSYFFTIWSFTGFEQNLSWAYGWVMSFSIWIPYGIVLGVLYERWSS